MWFIHQLSCTWKRPNSKRALSFQCPNDSLNKFRVLLRKPLNFPLQHELFKLLFLMRTSDMQSHPSSVSATQARLRKDTLAPIYFGAIKVEKQCLSLEGAQRQQLWQGSRWINISSGHTLLQPHTIFSSCAAVYSCEEELAMADIWYSLMLWCLFKCRM